jgi:hypothetical protein
MEDTVYRVCAFSLLSLNGEVICGFAWRSLYIKLQISTKPGKWVLLSEEFGKIGNKESNDSIVVFVFENMPVVSNHD